MERSKNKIGKRRGYLGKRSIVLGITIAMMAIASFTIFTTMPVNASSGTTSTIEVSQPVQITTDTHYDRNPSFFEADDGTYWLFFVRANSSLPHVRDGYNPDADKYDVYYTTSSNDGVTWTTPTKVTAINEGRRGMAAFQNATGDIWVFTSAPTGTGGAVTNNTIAYYTYDGSTWSGPYWLSVSGSHVDAFQASNGSVWVFYESGGVKCVYSADNGSTWSSEITVSSTTGDGIPKAIQDSDGTFHCVMANWATDGEYHYATSSDGITWTAQPNPVDVSGTTSCDPVLCETPTKLIMFYGPWNGTEDSQWLEVIYSTDGGSTWTDRRNVTAGGYGSTYWWDMWPEPYYDSDTGKLLLFYTSEKNGSSIGDGNIFMFEVDWDIDNDHFEAIQPAIDEATGTTINVAAGTYEEQILINKSLSLIGESGAKIVAPDTRNTYKIAESGSTWDPIIFAYGGTYSAGNNTVYGTATISVKVDGFEIDGGNKSSSNRFVGIFYRNIVGTASNNSIHSMYDSDGCGDGPETIGIMVYGYSNVTVENNVVKHFSRGGIGISGNFGAGDPVATVRNNIIYGYDETPLTGWWAENGIQMGYGASGSIIGNEVYNCYVNNPNWAATGIMIVDTYNVAVDGNYLEGNEQAIGVTDFPGSLYGSPWDVYEIENITVTNNTLESNEWGISIVNGADNIILQYNDILNTSGDAIDVFSYKYWYPSYDIPAPTNVEIHYNNIVNSGADGLWVGPYVNETVDATCNWWGSIYGPAHESNPLGNGENISDNDNVDFTPWLTAAYPDGYCIGCNCVDFDWNHWDDSPNIWLIPDGNVGIGTDNPQAKLDVNGSVRVQGNTEPYLFFVDANTGRIGIGTNNPTQTLEIYGMIKSSNIPYTQYIMKSSQAGAQEWSFFGSGTGWYVRNRDLGVNPFAIKNNAKRASLFIWPSEVVVNEKGHDLNFRVESDNNPNMLFVDASTDRVGIGTNNPQYELDVEGYVQAHGYYTGDIFFQKDGKKLWRMFEDENGLYVENIQTGEIYSLLSKDTGDHSLRLASMFLMSIVGAMGVALALLWRRKPNS